MKKISNQHISSLSEVSWWHRARYDFVLNSIIKYNKRIIADLGCGNINLVEKLRFNKFDSDGYDDNEIATSNPQIIKVDLNTKFHLEKKYDCITALDLIEHLKNDKDFVKSCYENLKDNGLLILTAPAHNFYFSDWDIDLGHYRRYNKKMMKQLLSENGFEIKEVFYFFSFLSIPVLTRKIFLKSNNSSDAFPKFNPIIAKIFYAASKLEMFLIKFGFNFKFGTSIFLTAIKSKNLLSA